MGAHLTYTHTLVHSHFRKEQVHTNTLLLSIPSSTNVYTHLEPFSMAYSEMSMLKDATIFLPLGPSCADKLKIRHTLLHLYISGSREMTRKPFVLIQGGGALI